MHAPRFDYYATLYCFRPLQVLTGPARRTKRIPILMYHSIEDEVDKHSYFDTHTSPERFAEHMDFLHRQDYRTISLHDLTSLFQTGRSPAGKTVVITFDDGYHSIRTNAIPVLQRYAYAATVFLPTRFIGDSERHTLNGKECLSWEDVLELRKYGVSFGSHSTSHPACLAALDDGRLAAEIRGSKAEIEQRLGQPVRCFSYPYAFPETERFLRKRLRDTLVQCGLEAGVTTILGTARPTDDTLFLPRLPVNSWDDTRLLNAKLKGYYDWLHAPQYLWKLFRNRQKGPLVHEYSV